MGVSLRVVPLALAADEHCYPDGHSECASQLRGSSELRLLPKYPHSKVAFVDTDVVGDGLVRKTSAHADYDGGGNLGGLRQPMSSTAGDCNDRSCLSNAYHLPRSAASHKVSNWPNRLCRL